MTDLYEKSERGVISHCSMAFRSLMYATTDNPFAGRVICGDCDHVFGRKIWNSTDERLRRIIWRCNGKYPSKGERGCDSKHIDDGVLYQAFVNVFNAMVEQKDCFISKWRVADGNELVRYKATQFIEILADAETVNEFDVDLYFALVEKITVYDGGRLVVSLLDGTDIECVSE